MSFDLLRERDPTTAERRSSAITPGLLQVCRGQCSRKVRAGKWRSFDHLHSRRPRRIKLLATSLGVERLLGADGTLGFHRLPAPYSTLQSVELLFNRRRTPLGLGKVTNKGKLGASFCNLSASVQGDNLAEGVSSRGEAELDDHSLH